MGKLVRNTVMISAAAMLSTGINSATFADDLTLAISMRSLSNRTMRRSPAAARNSQNRSAFRSRFSSPKAIRRRALPTSAP